MLPHFGFPFRGKPPALPHTLHDLEGVGVVQPVADQVQHDTVTGTDYLGDIAGSGFDQVLCVPKPHVGAMGQTGDLKQVGKVLGFTFDQHLLDKAGAKLRQTERADLGVDLLRCDAEGLGGKKQLVHVFVVHADVHYAGV